MPLIFNETTSLVCIKFCVAVQSLCGQFCKVKNNFIIFSDFYFMLPMDLFYFFWGGGGGGGVRVDGVCRGLNTRKLR